MKFLESLGRVVGTLIDFYNDRSRKNAKDNPAAYLSDDDELRESETRYSELSEARSNKPK